MNSRQATAKMFVPADSSGGETPEAKGAVQLKRLFTFVAIRVVQAQLEGLGNDGGFAPQVTLRPRREELLAARGSSEQFVA